MATSFVRSIACPELDAERQLYADLKLLDIDYVVVEHQAVFTVEESAKLDRDIPGAHTKNLFLKDAGGQHWLVTVPAHVRVDLKHLPDAVGCKRVSFGKAEQMVELLGISPGSVTPLAVLNDRNGHVRVVIDESLMAADQVNAHPLRNDATISISPPDLIRILSHWLHPPRILRIPTMM